MPAVTLSIPDDTALLKTVARVPLTREECERAARVAKVLTAAALANKYVQAYCREDANEPRPFWTVEKVRQNPPVRVEYEHMFGLGGLGETLCACRGKPTFGEFVGIMPVEPLDPVGYMNIMYVYKPSSPYNRRVEQRRWMKKRLANIGKGFRCLVKIAMENNKRDFVGFKGGRCVSFSGGIRGAVSAIRLAFDWDLATFWRMARGKEWAEIPTPAVQGALFDTAEDLDDVEVVRVEHKPKAPAAPLLALGLMNVERKPRPVQATLFDEEGA